MCVRSASSASSLDWLALDLLPHLYHRSRWLAGNMGVCAGMPRRPSEALQLAQCSKTAQGARAGGPECVWLKQLCGGGCLTAICFAVCVVCGVSGLECVRLGLMCNIGCVTFIYSCPLTSQGGLRASGGDFC